MMDYLVTQPDSSPTPAMEDVEHDTGGSGCCPVQLLLMQGDGWAILHQGDKYVRPGNRPFTSMNAAGLAASQAFGCPTDVEWTRVPGVVSVYEQRAAT